MVLKSYNHTTTVNILASLLYANPPDLDYLRYHLLLGEWVRLIHHLLNTAPLLLTDDLLTFIAGQMKLPDTWTLTLFKTLQKHEQAGYCLVLHCPGTGLQVILDQRSSEEEQVMKPVATAKRGGES